MKYVMFEHAGSGNHGCEAIVRSTVNMLGTTNKYFLQTLNPDDDIKFGINTFAHIITSKEDYISPTSIKGIMNRAFSKINPSVDYDTRESIFRHKSLLHKNSVALSIGGDNYCYGGIINSMRDKLRAFNAKEIPCVLWGCSIDENFINELVLKDLKQYKLITARESLTIETLKKYGITDNVVACSDPAFTLERQQTGWNNDIFKNYKVIGINVSDFMKYYNAYPDATFRNFKALIEYLLKETDYYIALIPHVRQKGNDDLVPCMQLANEFKNERIIVVNKDFNCMQLKDIISKCSLFIGCRTHSTIAAYSTCVPTLVVGYSVKARGIAKDIFGDDKDLLVDVREFKSDNDLLNAFLTFYERKDELKIHLHEFVPDYINRAYLAKTELEKRLKV